MRLRLLPDELFSSTIQVAHAAWFSAAILPLGRLSALRPPRPLLWPLHFPAHLAITNPLDLIDRTNRASLSGAFLKPDPVSAHVSQLTRVLVVVRA